MSVMTDEQARETAGPGWRREGVWHEDHGVMGYQIVDRDRRVIARFIRGVFVERFPDVGMVVDGNGILVPAN